MILKNVINLGKYDMYSYGYIYNVIWRRERVINKYCI